MSDHNQVTVHVHASTARTPSHAERCRTLAAEARSATLATVARDPAGFPYASLVAATVDGAGRPLLLLSSLAEHTGNLSAHAESSVLLVQPAVADQNPLAIGRVTILGTCRRVETADVNEARTLYLAAHPEASRYIGFNDFGMFRLEPAALRYVGGFGRMSWVSTADYLAAEPDPLAPVAAGVLAHMNADHAAACLDYARAFGNVPGARSAVMTAVDRYGFDLMVDAEGGPQPARIAFDTEVSDPDTVRHAMVALVKKARQQLK